MACFIIKRPLQLLSLFFHSSSGFIPLLSSFNIFSLYFVFYSMNMICLSMSVFCLLWVVWFLPWVMFFELPGSLVYWRLLILNRLGHYYFKYSFCHVVFFSFSSGIPITHSYTFWCFSTVLVCSVLIFHPFKSAFKIRKCLFTYF